MQFPSSPSAGNVYNMLDNSLLDELSLDDYYLESDLDSTSEDCSDEELEARSRSRKSECGSMTNKYSKLTGFEQRVLEMNKVNHCANYL